MIRACSLRRASDPAPPAASSRSALALGHAARAQALIEAAVSLLTVVGTAALPPTLLAHACTLFDAQRGTLSLVTQDGELLAVTQVTAEATSIPGSALDEARLADTLLHRTLPLVIDCDNDWQARQTFCDGGDCPLTIGFPLQWEGRQIGVVQLARLHGERHLRADDLGLLSQFADLAAAALVRHSALVAEPDADAVTVQLTQTLQHVVSHSAQLSASLSANLAAAEQERRRLAHELHDGVRATLLGAQLQIEAARNALRAGSREAGLQQLEEVQGSLASADTEMSRLVRALCPPRLAAGLSAALLDLGLRWASTAQTAVTFELTDEPLPLPEPAQLALYRITQEALSNIQRHADAHQAMISLRRHGPALVLRVADNGRGGAAPRGGGVGLFSLNERAHAIGARLQIESPHGSGTQIIVTLPLTT